MVNNLKILYKDVMTEMVELNYECMNNADKNGNI